MQINIIAAVADNNVIGLKGRLPWHIPSDLKRFKELTMGHGLLMGWKTWLDVSAKTRLPLPGRRHYIVTRNHLRHEVPAGCITRPSLPEAIDRALGQEQKLFIIGGELIFQEAMQYAENMYITRIFGTMPGDTFFPKINRSTWHRAKASAIIQKSGDSHATSHELWQRNEPA